MQDLLNGVVFAVFLRGGSRLSLAVSTLGGGRKLTGGGVWFVQTAELPCRFTLACLFVYVVMIVLGKLYKRMRMLANKVRVSE